MVLYDEVMVTRTVLPDEELDVTGSELHELLRVRLFDVLRFIFGDRALVLSDVFVRVRGDAGRDDEQVGPDIFIVPGAGPGTRTVYWVPDEPVPQVTLEVLSPANHRSDGAVVLAAKRALFARIGVPTHIEVDPDRGEIAPWVHDGTELVEGIATTSCDHPGLGGLRIEASPGQVRLFLPDGREFVDAPAEMVRADEEQARADQEQARAERLAQALRDAGIDPTTI